MNEDMMTEAERASIAADGTDGLLGERGKGVFHIHTLGCQMNVRDSEAVGALLEEEGLVRAEKEEDADLVIVNSCSVREKAEDTTRTTIVLSIPFEGRPLRPPAS